MSEFTIVPNGRFSLREAVEFGFGQRHSDRFQGVMRLAFCADDFSGQVGVELRQDDNGMHGSVVPAGGVSPPVAVVRRQVARILSLDHDIAAFEAVGGRDPVVGRLQAVAPGLLPPLFHSPYEAALWAVLSARRPARQMMQVRDRMSAEFGAVLEVAGRKVFAAPLPEQLLRIKEFPGVPEEKISRLHGIAEAAAAGRLDPQRLRAMGPEAVQDEMQRLRGIGPFYASLITIRAVGFTDVLPRDEPLVRQATIELYGLGPEAGQEDFERVAEPWRPYRTWVSVLIRAAGNRLSGTPVG